MFKFKVLGVEGLGFQVSSCYGFGRKKPFQMQRLRFWARMKLEAMKACQLESPSNQTLNPTLQIKSKVQAKGQPVILAPAPVFFDHGPVFLTPDPVSPAPEPVFSTPETVLLTPEPVPELS